MKEEIQEFIKKCDISLAIPGFYGLPVNVFVVGLQEYIDSKSTVAIDDYKAMVSVDEEFEQYWHSGEAEIDDATLDNIERIFKNEGYWDVTTAHSQYEIEEILNNINYHRKKNKAREGYEFRRKQSLRYIQKPEVRKEIFNRDGNKCLRCGKKHPLAIDHIVSVKNGGTDDHDNLQTLCVNCNSSKGDKND